MKTIKIERRKLPITNEQYPRFVRVTAPTHQKLKELAVKSGLPLARVADELLAAACEDVQIVD